MKTFTINIAIILFAVSLVSCKNSNEPEIKTVATTMAEDQSNALDPNARYAKAEFEIEGMTCAMGCAKTIEKKLAKMDGVKSARVDFDSRMAMVEYDEAKQTPSSLEETVSKAGNSYTVAEMKNVESFSIEKICPNECCAEKTHEEKANCTLACCKS